MAVVKVINITDIDDKIVARSAEEGIDASQLTRHWERAFQHDMLRLGVRPPAAWLRVSDHMEAICTFIEQLVTTGHAYVADDGVWFDCSTLPTYGKLRKVDENEMVENETAETASPAGGSRTKRQRRDFALWKTSRAGKGAVGPEWPSPWGGGRPGWHIECSAIAHSVFGEVRVRRGIGALVAAHLSQQPQPAGGGRRLLCCVCPGDCHLVSPSTVCVRGALTLR